MRKKERDDLGWVSCSDLCGIDLVLCNVVGFIPRVKEDFGKKCHFDTQNNRLRFQGVDDSVCVLSFIYITKHDTSSALYS